MSFTCRLIGFDRGLNENVYRVFFKDGKESIVPESKLNALRTIV